MPSCPQCKALIPHEVVTIFCPGCGRKLKNLEIELSKRKDENIEEVNMAEQIILNFIPFGNLYAAERIDKFGKYPLYGLLAGILSIGLSLLASTQFQLMNIVSPEDPLFVLFWFTVWWLIASSLMVYFMIRWSREFNQLQALLKKLND
jgi:hypothetical protein